MSSKLKFFILSLITLLNLSLQAEDLPQEFHPTRWSQGLHLFTGLGLNTSTFTSTEESVYLAMGLNLKSDVGWYFNDRWAIESSASVKFNELNNDLVWDTLLTVGMRYRTNQRGNYARLFLGVSETVLFPGGSRPEQGAYRYHLKGEAIGVSVGRLYQTQSKVNWFVEFSTTVQFIKYRQSVALDGEAPIIIETSSVANNSKIYSIYVTAGVMLF